MPPYFVTELSQTRLLLLGKIPEDWIGGHHTQKNKVREVLETAWAYNKSPLSGPWTTWDMAITLAAAEGITIGTGGGDTQKAFLQAWRNLNQHEEKIELRSQLQFALNFLRRGLDRLGKYMPSHIAIDGNRKPNKTLLAPEYLTDPEYKTKTRRFLAGQTLKKTNTLEIG